MDALLRFVPLVLERCVRHQMKELIRRTEEASKEELFTVLGPAPDTESALLPSCETIRRQLVNKLEKGETTTSIITRLLFGRTLGEDGTLG